MSQPVTFQLTETDQQTLLQIARNAVRCYLDATKPPTPTLAGSLGAVRGIFVSIHSEGELRGCIGNIHSVSPLYRSAAECAIAAAVGDPRFMPMTAMELPRVEFEISVLSPLERIRNVIDIEVGRHGLLVSKRNNRGLLLPQVGATFEWSRERFLQETCKKAGLGPDDWQQDATIEVFTAVVFNEKQFHVTALQ
jgi:AmmeMemoRadiSam system protein A